MPTKGSHCLKISLTKVPMILGRKDLAHLTVKAMKVTVVCACVYITLHGFICYGFFERLAFRSPISTINNLYISSDTNRGELDKTNEDKGALAENAETDVVVSNYFTSSEIDSKEENVHQRDTADDIQNYFIRIKNERIYIYSAIVHRNSLLGFPTISTKGAENSDFVALNGWRHNGSDPYLKCCYMLRNQKILSSPSKFLKQHVHVYNSSLKAVQYRCPYFKHGLVIGVGLSNLDSQCPTSKAYYLNPIIVTKTENVSIGVCSKLSYGSIKTGPLVEWFEALRLLGVDKVFSYNANLSSEAQLVFDHYRSIGLLEYFPYEVPEQAINPREMGEKSIQAWTDEQVIIFDCQERLNAFSYAVFLDKDEILLPRKTQLRNSLRTYFNSLDKDIEGQRYYSEIHLTDWKPYRPEHPLFIGKYAIRSVPVQNTAKYMIRPQFVPPGECIAHSFKLFSGKRPSFAPPAEIVLHHFRSCQKDRKFFAKGNFCEETERSNSRKIANLADAITNNVLYTLRILALL